VGVKSPPWGVWGCNLCTCLRLNGNNGFQLLNTIFVNTEALSMKIVLLQTGKTTDRNMSELVDLYSKRIKKYISFEVVTIPELKNTKNMPVQEQLAKEAGKIIQSVSDNDYIVLLDERGKEYRTIEFSSFLEKAFLLPRKRIIFIIGGPWGFSKEVYTKADEKISLSKMTFSHQMVRLLFLEQLYRAFTIIKGEPYHHE
jgi:23S rRNA (pseudouridine1915-N3)-methyltransferase